MAKISRRRFLETSTAASISLTAAGAVAADEKKAEAVADGKNNGLRLCRFSQQGDVKVGFYFDDAIVDVQQLAAELKVKLPSGPVNLLDYLPPDGKALKAVADLDERLSKMPASEQSRLKLKTASVKLLVPIADPKKVILLAGNYGAHIVESGGVAPERKETYPYFFWKPPTTTLTHPGDPIKIPKVSPDHVDWEIELGVVIGKQCKDVSEKDALNYVAGYSVCNDVSDRKFHINPDRKKREKDGFFDWLHGKWHDTFLPMGPCVRSAATVPDPQKLAMKLKVNGQVMQDASTAQMIFPVAAIVSILSSFITFEAGDIIVTGTPAGVGAARKPPVFLKKGDIVEAEIAGIGLLKNPVV
jgi:2,4-didehydro-3-deoxy-L-rhamnonate hydrolase